jgi:putative methanogenesis marker 13 metalloprotein
MEVKQKNMKYVQPRPSSIVAALYTARDLEVEIAILHGPSGCSFKHARLLEEDGMRCLTTSLSDNDFIFGGKERLIDVLTYAQNEFSPKRMAVIGTCVSMIIGEDLEAIVDAAEISCETIAVDIHAGFSENIEGVIAVLVQAEKKGWISLEELKRQKQLLLGANRVERERGAAAKSYIAPSRGDLKHIAAVALLEKIDSGGKGMCIMNAKKETAYMFIDPLLAVHELRPDAEIGYYANLGNKGLLRVARMAHGIDAECKERGLSLTHIGSLDEYGVLGDDIGVLIEKEKPDYLLVSGVPHAIPEKYITPFCVSITNGPRQYEPLKEQGHDYVVVEIDLHPHVLGVHSIQESEFGAVLRSLDKTTATKTTVTKTT